MALRRSACGHESGGRASGRVVAQGLRLSSQRLVLHLTTSAKELFDGRVSRQTMELEVCGAAGDSLSTIGL